MNKNILVVLGGIFAISVLLVGMVYADSSRESFTLWPTESSSATGRASVRMFMQEGLSTMELKVWTDNLFMEAGRVYEVWLVDDDDSDYKLSVGTFQPTPGGKGLFEMTQSMVNPAIYDKVVVTKEPMNDIDPAPKTMVLTGEIPDSISDEVTMYALMKGRYENPMTSSRATGRGVFVVDTSSNMVNFNIVYKGLDGAETGAHIHGFAPAGENAGILFTLPSGTTKIGSWHYSESQEEDILAGLTYANVHSHLFPGGEIRGQIYFNL